MFSSDQDVCNDHPSEAFTNFCSHFDCLKPLCPECIDYHNKYHLSQSTQPQISSLKHARQACMKKLKAGIQSLSDEVENPEIQNLIDPSHHLLEEKRKLSHFRERILYLLDTHLSNLEHTLQKASTSFPSSSLMEGVERGKNLVKDLEGLYRGVEAGGVGVLGKVCRLDLKGIIEKIRGEVGKGKRKEEGGVKVVLEEGKLEEVKEALERAIWVRREELGKDSGIKDLPRTSEKSLAKSGIQSSQIIASSPFPPSRQMETFYITEPSFFLPSFPPILPFFQSDPPTLHILSLPNSSFSSSLFTSQLKKIPLRVTTPLPAFHKSLIVPNGDIYLTGGSRDLPEMEGVASGGAKGRGKSGLIMRWDGNDGMKEMGEMILARSSHGICYLGGWIYSVGGFGKGQSMLNECERFNTTTFKTQQIAHLNYPAASLSVCGFYQYYLFKFGGMEIQHTLSPYIEKYDTRIDKWTVIDPRLNISEGLSFSLLSNSACIPINRNDILVFGGYSEDNSGSAQTFILSYDHNTEDDNCIIRGVSVGLPSPEGFWNSQAIIHDRRVYSLQNISYGEDCAEDARRIVVYDGKEWKSLSSS